MRKFLRAVLAVFSAALLLTACGGESKEELLASAKAYLAKDDNKSAIIQLKNALQKAPESAEARYLLGKAFFQSGDTVSAAIELRKALDRQYPATQALPLLAKSLVINREYKQVVAQYSDTTLADKTATADLKTSLAFAYASQGLAENSRAALRAAFEAVPDYPPALLFEAREKARQRQFDEAFALLEKSLAAAPSAPDAWHLKGDLLRHAKNDKTAAAAAYRKALSLSPSYTPARIAMISLSVEQGDLKGAKTEVDELRKILPQHPQTVYFDAQLAYLNRDNKKARDLVQQLLKVAPDNFMVLQLAGAVEFNDRSYLQAENHLNKALQQSPDAVPARRLLAQTYLRSGQAVKALATLQPLLAQADTDPDTLSLIAEAYLQSGDFKQAETYFKRVARLKPDDVKSRSVLALNRMNNGNADAALAELQSIATADSGTYADLSLVSAYIHKNDFDNALKASEAIERKQPNKPFTANLQGQIHLMRKDVAQARSSFERALKIDPLFIPAAASLATLDLNEKKPEAAKKRFESILAIDPKNMQAMLVLAKLKARSGAPKEEIAELLKNAVKLNPTEIAPRIQLTEHYLALRDGKAALLVAQDAVAALGSDKPELIDALGRAQVATGDANQAISSFNQLAALQRNSPQAFMRLAGVYLATKDRDAARKSLKQALDIKPDLLAAQQTLIEIELADKHPDEALIIARAVQKQRPSEAVGLLMEGGIEVARQNLAAAAAIYRAGLEKFGSTEIAIKLHSVLNISKKEADAEKMATSWLRDHPKDTSFMAYLGELSLFKRNYPAAESYFRRIIDVQPDNAMALNNAAWTAAALNKRGAVELAQKATALAPESPDFLDTLATALAADNQINKAIDVQKKAMLLAPDRPVFRLQLAKLYIKAGDKAAAKSELDALAKLNDKFHAQSEVSELLKKL